MCSCFVFIFLNFRMAANEPSFMSMQLKIIDQRHKQKLNLKALDAVLFGPPLRKLNHNLLMNDLKKKSEVCKAFLFSTCRSTA